MKNIINYISIAVTLLILTTGCRKDEDRIIANTGTAGTLSANQSNIVLTEANAADTLQRFSWVPTDYGFKAAVRYVLEIARAGTNFAAPSEVNMGSDTEKKYTGAELNQLALVLGLLPGSAGDLEVRVRSSISDSIPSVYSNTLAMSLTPYSVIINYPSLYVAGDYQGWNPATAERISSKQDNGQYEGYVYFPPGGSYRFKFTSAPDWNNTNYGWESSTTTGSNVSGTFNTTGGDLFVPGPGYYLLKANTETNTWSGELTQWGLIGDGVPGTGWNSDQDMTYDPATKTWNITLDLVVGKIKFRANDGWDLNYGDNNADLSLEPGGADINITSAGNYTVTLNLGIPGNYSYTVKKN